MKLRRYFAVLATAALTAFAAGSCAEPRTNFSTPTAGSSPSRSSRPEAAPESPGVIDETTGEVYFPIPKKEREKYDITSLMVRAEVEYDTFITPSLTGLKDFRTATTHSRSPSRPGTRGRAPTPYGPSTRAAKTKPITNEKTLRRI